MGIESGQQKSSLKLSTSDIYDDSWCQGSFIVFASLLKTSLYYVYTGKTNHSEIAGKFN